MAKEDVEVFQSVFDKYIHDKIESEDLEYEDIMHDYGKESERLA